MVIVGRKPKRRATALGKRLTVLREGKGWTQKEAAEKLGVGLRTWIAWELGEALPDKFKQAHICKMFGVSSLN